jgi:hypothetical protein
MVALASLLPNDQFPEVPHEPELQLLEPELELELPLLLELEE